MSRLKKFLLISGGAILLGFLLIMLLISPIAKWLVEKYDVEYTGREITMDKAYVNPLTGYIHFSQVDIKESESDSSFLSMKGLTANFGMIKLIQGKYEISQFILDEPIGYAIYHNSTFNFSDILERFKGDTLDTLMSDPVNFSLLNIEIKSGTFYYVEDQTPVNYYIKNVNIESAGLKFKVDTLPITFAFSSGMGEGDVEGDITIDLENLNYGLNFEIKKFNLEIINQYLKDITEYGTFKAILDAKMESTGNFNSADSLSTKGNLSVTEFHFGKSEEEDFASFESLTLSINKLSPKNLIYQFDSVILNQPFFRFEMYEDLDNIQTMFGKDGQNVSEINSNPDKFNLVIEIAQLVEQLSRNFFRSQYNVGKIAIYDANIEYSDYTLSEEFSIGLNPFTAIADSVDKRKDRIDLMVTSRIKPFGKAFIHLDINPKDSTSFNMNYNFSEIALTIFNPYLLNYTSFPLDRGTMEANGQWRVRNGNISSENHLLLIDPRAGKKVKNKNNKWIPVPLALAFVRESGNVVDYEIPISGNLKNPNFHLRDIILDLLKNIFIKPATTGYRLEVRNTEREIEKSFNLNWAAGKSEILSPQKKFIKRIVRFLEENPNAVIQVTPTNYNHKEKESIMLFEAKRKYMNSIRKLGNQLSESDSIEIERMSIKDAEFVKYLNDQVADEMLFTTYHKALNLIDPSVINKVFSELKVARERTFIALFKEEGVENQVHLNDEISTTPYNGFSFYSISYKDNFPEYVTKAFEKMNELDKTPIREKYEKNRTKSLKSKK